jgi:phenylalanyl-tRNA synthetase beta chain
MLAMLAYNINRDVREVRLFEKGTVFTGSTTEVREVQGLALGLTGMPRATSLHTAKDAGIFELKGAIESLLSLFAASPEDLSSSAAAAVTFSTQTPAWIEPGRGAVASLNGREIAWSGELATAEREARKLRQPAYVAEIDLQSLYALPLRRATAREISRYQAVERDFSFTFADAVQWHAIEQAVNSLAIPELTRLAPVEIFRDSKATTVPAGHHALLLRCVFQSPERTLREDELSRWSAQVIDALTKLGGVLRA